MEPNRPEKEAQEYSPEDQLKPVLEAWRNQIQNECSAAIHRLKEKLAQSGAGLCPSFEPESK